MYLELGTRWKWYCYSGAVEFGVIWILETGRVALGTSSDWVVLGRRLLRGEDGQNRCDLGL